MNPLNSSVQPGCRSGPSQPSSQFFQGTPQSVPPSSTSLSLFSSQLYAQHTHPHVSPTRSMPPIPPHLLGTKPPVGSTQGFQTLHGRTSWEPLPVSGAMQPLVEPVQHQGAAKMSGTALGYFHTPIVSVGQPQGIFSQTYNPDCPEYGTRMTIWDRGLASPDQARIWHQAWGQISWAFDSDGFFNADKALYPPPHVRHVRPTGIVAGFAFLEVRPPQKLLEMIRSGSVTLGGTGKTDGHLFGRDGHPILDSKMQSRVQDMLQAPSFRQGNDWDRFEFLVVDWFRVKGRYLPEDEQVKALIATHPQEDEVHWLELASSPHLGFFEFLRHMAHDGRRGADQSLALSEFEAVGLPTTALNPSPLARWFAEWLRRGRKVLGGYTTHMAQERLMRIFHQHAKLEVTPGFKHAVSKVRLRQMQARLRFTYIELYLFIMPLLMTEEEAGWYEEHYSGSSHHRAFSQSPGRSHSRSGRDPERTSVRGVDRPRDRSRDRGRDRSRERAAGESGQRYDGRSFPFRGDGRSTDQKRSGSRDGDCRRSLTPGRHPEPQSRRSVSPGPQREPERALRRQNENNVRGRSPERSESRPRTQSRSCGCLQCGGDHMKADCPKLKTEVARRTRSKDVAHTERCFECGVPHMKADCPKLKAHGVRRSASRDQRGNSPHPGPRWRSAVRKQG